MKVRLTHRIFLFLLCFLCMIGKNGGIIKAQYGGVNISLNDLIVKQAQEEKKKEKMRKENIKKELKRNSEYEISRSISMQLDLLNMLTFTSVPSKLIGITSTVISQSVNMKHNFNIRNILIQTMNLGFDISNFSPALNIMARGNKIVTNIKEWSPRYFTLWSTSSNRNAIYYQDSFRKIYYNRMDVMTARDWVNIINGIILSPSIYQEKEK